MGLFTPLTPYLLWIKLGAAVVIGGALFIGGCNHGKEWQAKEDAAALTEADALANERGAQVAILAGTVTAIDAETAKAQAEADALAARAKEAEARAAQSDKAAADAIAKAGRDVEDAKRDPACRKQLEAPVCAALL